MRDGEGDKEEERGAAPPNRPRLGADDVHVWAARLDVDRERLASLAELLSEDERARAERFAFERLRQRFTAAHGILREILAGYADVAPERLRFETGAEGKPFLTEEAADGGLRFNMSHSAGKALYAVTLGREVGVDVEQVCPDRDHARIAERFFSAREVQALRALSEEEQRTAFFRCWTRKEAYVKAVGKGLAIPLDRFAVSLAPRERAAFLDAGDGAGVVSGWSLCNVPVDGGYEGAVCVEGERNYEYRILNFECPGDGSPQVSGLRSG